MAEFGSSESRFDVLTPHDQHCNLYSKANVDKVYHNYNMNQWTTHPPGLPCSAWTWPGCPSAAGAEVSRRPPAPVPPGWGRRGARTWRVCPHWTTATRCAGSWCSSCEERCPTEQWPVAGTRMTRSLQLAELPHLQDRQNSGYMGGWWWWPWLISNTWDNGSLIGWQGHHLLSLYNYVCVEQTTVTPVWRVIDSGHCIALHNFNPDKIIMSCYTQYTAIAANDH